MKGGMFLRLAAGGLLLLCASCGGGGNGGGMDAAMDATMTGDGGGVDGNRADTAGGDVPVDHTVADGPMCMSATDCDDHVYCNGTERCMPGAPGANARGCLPAIAPACPADGGLSCDENRQMCVPEICLHGGDGDGDHAIAKECGGNDCDDSDPNRFPGNPEVCAVSTASDGDGGTVKTRIDPTHDEDCDPTTFANPNTHDGDQDGDGYIDRACANSDQNGMINRGTDCEDLAAVTGLAGTPRQSTVQPGDVHPMQTESCNGVDDNCNGATDEALAQTYYRDCDGDQAGDTADTGAPGCGADQFTMCSGHPPVTDHGDCDDTNAAINPGATEVCDSAMVDENCDGDHNPGCQCNIGDNPTCGSSLPGCTTGTQTCVMDTTGSHLSDCSVSVTIVDCWADGDRDGYAVVGAAMTQACSCPAGSTSRDPSTGADCDDANAARNPGAGEICNAVDDNCNGTTDENLPTQTFYQDCDGDGYGAAGTGMVACSAARGPACNGHVAVTNGTDCNDGNGSVWQNLTGYPDADHDGHCTSGAAQTICTNGSLSGTPYIAACSGIGDCDDSNGGAWASVQGYQDTDGDGYCRSSSPSTFCTNGSLPAGYRSSCTGYSDCDDGKSDRWQTTTCDVDLDGDGLCGIHNTSACVGSSCAAASTWLGGQGHQPGCANDCDDFDAYVGSGVAPPGWTFASSNICGDIRKSSSQYDHCCGGFCGDPNPYVRYFSAPCPTGYTFDTCAGNHISGGGTCSVTNSGTQCQIYQACNGLEGCSDTATLYCRPNL